ncbi:MAG: methyltransferase domain-containing protein [Nitrospinaceae bacterium]|nr:class I SAM-dependent methyltransferase [Nitrospinaceae bacterium]NIR56866.1 class I SAM-dependent methyltransferase [Nitrospinaceae bacterium]NIS87332.1 class I SAM-dependent methyltransferase [Nitrospinaceae bacterium]NIT84186.1 class I SAM-dependent methyltransferase [Nitrospinaceae bacterium]NIU46372.1 class I SAM-dependent methyltransferase [Nitrospinaceae bacterium]
MPELENLKPAVSETPETSGNGSSQCNLCGAADYEVLARKGRDREPLNTVICKKCGLVWSHPFPIDPQQYYQKHYRILYKGTYTPKKKHIFRNARVALGRFKLLRHLLKPGWRTLEVGSGGGEFLYLLKKLGCDARGIEPNEGYAEYARKEYDLNITTGFLQNTEFEKNSFNLVTMWHVFEHMDNPSYILRKVHGFLAPEGLLIIEVPNIEATCASPQNTFHIAHLYNFNRFTLRKMAERAGFSMIEETMGRDGGNIFQYFKKDGPASREIQCEIEGNYQRIKNVIDRWTPLKYYFSSYPYSRVLSKVRQFFREKDASDEYTGGREILDHLMEDINENSLSQN